MTITLEAAMELLKEWNDLAGVGAEQCRHDHHGYCQAHFLEDDCLAKRTNKLLNRFEGTDEGQNFHSH